ncbi:hypothetical protein QTI33_01925 [Variovorax sp. J22P271]|uniref:hypothetical protein n=1 Tax=Variovorax davisae TaxID=3053515 RepID=UPI0025791CA3|nr:hypothetical protein [Variovorax sp. J22P271]MDM0030896.1 hypothetical protein [Variovorax sp. J22P271]
MQDFDKFIAPAVAGALRFGRTELRVAELHAAGRMRQETGPPMLTSNRSWHLFAALVLLHAAGVLFAPAPLAPLVAASVYLPLMPLQQMGVPVFGSGESGGWAAPSVLGWAAVVAVWAVTWWAVAQLGFGLWRRVGSSRSGEGV